MRILKDKKGEAYIRACISILIVCIVFVSLLNFVLLTILTKGQRSGAIQVLDQYAQNNAVKIHDSIKIHSEETDTLDATIFIEDLCEAQGLTSEGDTYVSYNRDGDYRYIISDVVMSFTVENTTKIHVSYTLTVPYDFWGTTTWINVPLVISTRLDAKFEIDETDDLVIYTVNHWKKGLDDTYVLDQSWTQRAEANTYVTPVVISYPGFTAPSTQRVLVKADRTTVVDYYYDRESYTITVTAGEGVASVTGGGTYHYGQVITITATLESGCTTVCWYGDTNWMKYTDALSTVFTVYGDAELFASAE